MKREEMLDIYKVMHRIREFEIEAIELAMRNDTRAAVHTYHGQEAIGATVCSFMTNDDYITSTHRGHGHCIAKGANLEKMFAELLGKEEGYCKGKGGSMHIADPDTGNLGANGIVSGGIPIATGAALSMKLGEEDHFVVSFFGDGATSEGGFHESLNLASVWDLPIIYVCENNQYAISTHVSKLMNIENVADRAAGYGMLGMVVDGNSVPEVYKAMKVAKEYVLSGKGPVLLEMKTYRQSGHYFGDNENYRSKDEVAEWKAKDPILYLEKIMLDNGFTEDELAEIKKKERADVKAASQTAKGFNDPKVEDLENDVYDPVLEPLEWVQLTEEVMI